MLFDKHEPLSPGLQGILLLADEEDLLGLCVTSEVIRREILGDTVMRARFPDE
jgi:hypothetical protein